MSGAGRERRRWLSSLTRREGRPAGIILALGVGLLMATAEYRPQVSTRHALFDAYQRLLPRERVNDGVVIVAIDERSLQELGHWPWPRVQMAQLVDRITSMQPAVLAFDVLFAEADRLSPRTLAGTIGPVLAGAPLPPERIATLVDSDEVFAQSLAQLPVVLGVGAVRESDVAEGIPYRATLRESGGAALPHLPVYRGSLRSLPVIDAAALGHGIFNPSSQEGIVRHVPTLASLAGVPLPGLALEALRVASGSELLDVRVTRGGIAGVGIGGAEGIEIPTAPSGAWWLHFSDFRERPHVSAAAVLKGEVPDEVLRGRVVLLGYTALGLLDVATTPLGPAPGIEIHAEAIDNALDGRLLSRPHWAPWLELLLYAALAAVAIVVVPAVKPATGVALYLGLAAVLLAAAFGTFQGAGLLLDVANPLSSAALIFGLMLVLAYNEAQWRQLRLQRALSASREAQARLEGELDAARRIQLGMLPRPQEVLKGESRVAIAASLESALVVGGDLYDFFKVDERQLFFLIGDVSGKGLPASLFMALAKALTKAAAERNKADPGRTLSAAGAELASENPEQLFVTAIAGALDLDTGALALCCAGHDMPYLLAPGAAPRQLEGDGGPPLCVIDDFEYPTVRLQLSPGEALCLYTDGVTEAQDMGGAFYGAGRLRECLARASGSLDDCASAIRSDVFGFMGRAPMADDVTLLLLRWEGPRGALSAP